MKKRVIIFLVVSVVVILIIFFYFHSNKSKKELSQIKTDIKEENYSSNIIDGVNYTSKDSKGNEYIINAEKGEIDISNSNIIYLTNVNALIKLNNSENVTVTSNFGKYNINNYDTIFSRNVIIKYLNNKITGDYADFSIGRNSMIISKNVIYSNSENILKSDAISINIETKDTKIFMYETNKKVNIKSLN
jgi:hypothetical protein